MSIHSPRATYNALNKINKELKIQFYDSSYKNDSCDSLEHEYVRDKFIKVIIPNSKEDDPDRELFNEYLVILTEFGEGQFFAELDDVVDYLKSINLKV
jgi:hypothetical protein